MNKDERYEVVKDMIESGRVTEFRQIFKYMPKTVMAHDLSTNTTRMTRLIDNVHQLTIEEVHIISELVDVEHATIYKLIAKQYLNSLKPKA
jgi:hypothetical protein